MTELPCFDTMTDAECWMEEQVDDGCMDNYRFAFVDDTAALAVYDEQREQGCCGYFDSEVVVAGRRARIGCNYGH